METSTRQPPPGGGAAARGITPVGGLPHIYLGSSSAARQSVSFGGFELFTVADATTGSFATGNNGAPGGGRGVLPEQVMLEVTSSALAARQLVPPGATEDPEAMPTMGETLVAWPWAAVQAWAVESQAARYRHPPIRLCYEGNVPTDV